FFFFFSSRRRHTRWPRDWSSDVCSSDLSKLRDLALMGDWAVPAAPSEPASMPVRPYQFCRYLAALFGPEIMEEMIASAVVMAKEIGRASCRERVESTVVAVSLEKK